MLNKSEFNLTIFSTNQIDHYSRLNNLINKFFVTSKWTNVILITIITLFGFYGNLISTKIFLSKSFNKNSVKSLRVYLVTLSISDLLVLIFHYIDFTFRSWIQLLGVGSSLNFVDKCLIICKLIPYLRNVCRTISVYTLVLMTLQRLIVLHHSSYGSRWCSLGFNKRLIGSLIILSLMLNPSPLFINHLVQSRENTDFICSIDENFMNAQFLLDILFVLFTILLPALVIFVLSFFLYNKIKLNLSKSEEGQNFITITHNNGPDTVQQIMITEKFKYKDYLNYLNEKYPQMPNIGKNNSSSMQEMRNKSKSLPLSTEGINKIESDENIPFKKRLSCMSSNRSSRFVHSPNKKKCLMI